MVWFVAAWVLHLVAGFFYVFSGLLAPAWAVGVLMAIWFGLAFMLARRNEAGARSLTIPAAAAAIWFVVLGLGDRFLGWTA